MDLAVALLEQPVTQEAFSNTPLKCLTVSITATKIAWICHHCDLQVWMEIDRMDCHLI